MFGKHLICMLSAGIVLGCSAGKPSAADLPDSVVVRIDGRHDIVRSFALRSWSQQRAGSPVDSITPAAVARFLDLLVDAELVTGAALRSAAPWSPADSAGALALSDRLLMAVALDSVLQAAQAQGPPIADSLDPMGALGERARAQTVERLGAVFDEAALQRVASLFAALPRPSPDSSLGAQMHVLERRPVLSPEDSSRVLVHSTAGEVRAAEVVNSWARLSIAVRPRIDTPEQVRDMTANQLFERVLRGIATSGRFDRDPRVGTAMTAYTEQVARSQYLEREVLRDLTPDSSAIAAYWKAHSSDWTVPPEARGIRLVLTELAAAVRMGAVLADAAQAESLATRAERGGAHYRFVASETVDSVLYHRAVAAGADAVVGPVAEGGSWWVARVTRILPGRQPAWSEVRDEVTEHWLSLEAERRAVALAQRLRRTKRVELNPVGVKRLADELRDSTRPNAAASAP